MTNPKNYDEKLNQKLRKVQKKKYRKKVLDKKFRRMEPTTLNSGTRVPVRVKFDPKKIPTAEGLTFLATCHEFLYGPPS